MKLLIVQTPGRTPWMGHIPQQGCIYTEQNRQKKNYRHMPLNGIKTQEISALAVKNMCPSVQFTKIMLDFKLFKKFRV
jgi:hypothetical protein